MIDREWMTGPVKAVLALAMVFTLSASFSCAWACTYSGGTGEPNSPYRIKTAEDLNDIGDHVEDFNKCFILVNDIDMADYTGTEFNIIGYYNASNDHKPFKGVFDGNGHTISNLTYDCNNANYIGLFGYVYDANAKIKDLTLINANVDGGTGAGIGSLVGLLDNATIVACGGRYCDVSGRLIVGGLVGWNHGGNISNCYAEGTVSATESVAGGLVGFCTEGGVILNCYTKGNISAQEGPWAEGDAGGLVGDSRNSLILDCSSDADVSSEVMAGGLVGTNWASTLSGCYATGTVSGTDWVAGGLVGYNVHNSVIHNCYATGNVSVPEGIATGGLVGVHQFDSLLSYCYTVGSVSGKDNVGGLVGYHYDSSYNKCFWDCEVNADVNGIGNTADPNVIGKSTAEMQTESTFTDAGWDFVGEIINGPNDIWTIHETVDYPKHVWRLVNFIGWYEVDLLDFAFFAGRWGDDNCGISNDCDGVDLDFSDAVDWRDLKIFCDHWLQGY